MNKARKPTVPKAAGLTFESLVPSIRGVDADLAAQAGRAVNISHQPHAPQLADRLAY